MQGGIVRVLFSGALFTVTPAECDSARKKLELKMNRQATAKEIVKEANTTTPEPEPLKERVLGVLECLHQSDLATDMRRAQGHDGLLPLKAL